MESELLKELLPLLANELGVAWTLLLSGTGLILVNLATHRLVARHDFRVRQREQMDRHLKPLLRGTADLISRLVEILITQKAATVDAIRDYAPDDLDKRLTKELPTAAELNRRETTAYRLVNYLALSASFSRETSGLSPFPRLDRAEYFLQHKLAVGLRGNLYGLSFFSTELQEDMARAYLESNSDSRAVDLSAGMLLANLKSGRFPLDFFRRALDFVGIVPPYAAGQGSATGQVAPPNASFRVDTAAEAWKHTLCLAQFGVYLIDFYQELANDPQWEEHRVFFVELVRQWNVAANKRRYLYEPGDLKTNDYLRTFPAQRTSRQSALYGLPLFGLRDVLSRLRTAVVLNLRGSRFGKRHHPKVLRRWGVRIKRGREFFDVRWHQDPQITYEQVRKWLDTRLLKM